MTAGEEMPLMGLRTATSRQAAPGKRIRKVAITGGGCAGKTTFMGIAKNVAESLGWTVVTIPEVPTLVMENGVGPGTRAPFREFERSILSLQIAWEEAFEHVAETMEGDAPVLILCDRGIPEISAYMEREQYLQILDDAGMSEESAKETYDAAIHLVSVVDGAPGLYTTDNNEQRYETPEVALRQELRIRECWDGYDRRFVIRADATSFDAKMQAASVALIGILDEEAGMMGETDRKSKLSK